MSASTTARSSPDEDLPLSSGGALVWAAEQTAVSLYGCLAARQWGTKDVVLVALWHAWPGMHDSLLMLHVHCFFYGYDSSQRPCSSLCKSHACALWGHVQYYAHDTARSWRRAWWRGPPGAPWSCTPTSRACSSTPVRWRSPMVEITRCCVYDKVSQPGMLASLAIHRAHQCHMWLYVGKAGLVKVFNP